MSRNKKINNFLKFLQDNSKAEMAPPFLEFTTAKCPPDWGALSEIVDVLKTGCLFSTM